MLTGLLRTTSRHTFPSPSFLRHIDCQVDISVSATWHLADWAEVSSSAIAGPAEESRWKEEGKYRAKNRGGGGGRGGGRDKDGKQERKEWSKGAKRAKRDLLWSPLSQQHVVFQMSIFPRRYSVNEPRWECLPELPRSLVSCTDTADLHQRYQTNPEEISLWMY